MSASVKETCARPNPRMNFHLGRFTDASYDFSASMINEKVSTIARMKQAEILSPPNQRQVA